MLTGKFVLHDNGESYRCGEIKEGESFDEFCLVLFDCFESDADAPPVLPLEAISLASMSERLQDGSDMPVWYFFETREELDAWLTWIRRSGSVVSMVRP